MQAIIAALKDHGRTVGVEELMFTSPSLMRELLDNEPFAFLVAALVDKQMATETAWQLPEKLRARLGHLDPVRLSKLSEDELLGVIQQIDGKPRYQREAAKSIVRAAKRVCEHYECDTRNTWRGRRVWDINRRLQEFHGIGPGIAAMIVNLLTCLNEIELRPEDRECTEIKPDVHLIRVFRRLGLVEGSTEQEAIQAARRLCPEYPAILDAPAWHIGRKWCRPKNPNCPECPLSAVCPRIDVE